MSNSQPSRLEQIEITLDRVANLLGETAGRTIANETIIEEHDRLINGLIQSAQANTEAVASLIDTQQEILYRIDAMQVEIRDMQAEVRGIQTENRRILDRLFGDNSQT
ncbi:MAG: hypothetical protein ACRC2R_16305 [Xenococcaceae cyanobacterium]